MRYTLSYIILFLLHTYGTRAGVTDTVSAETKKSNAPYFSLGPRVALAIGTSNSVHNDNGLDFSNTTMSASSWSALGFFIASNPQRRLSIQGEITCVTEQYEIRSVNTYRGTNHSYYDETQNFRFTYQWININSYVIFRPSQKASSNISLGIGPRISTLLSARQKDLVQNKTSPVPVAYDPFKQDHISLGLNALVRVRMFKRLFFSGEYHFLPTPQKFIFLSNQDYTINIPRVALSLAYAFKIKTAAPKHRKTDSHR